MMKQMLSTNNVQALDAVAGKQIERADSSLTAFAIRFADGSGLLLEAAGDASRPEISIETRAAEALPEAADAVCAVDWGWLAGSTIIKATSSAATVHFRLEPAGPLSVSALAWQRSSFLAFQPFRPARSPGD